METPAQQRTLCLPLMLAVKKACGRGQRAEEAAGGFDLIHLDSKAGKDLGRG